MKKSEVIKELLESYYFQNGKSANKRVTEKAEKMIKTFKREENNAI